MCIIWLYAVPTLIPQHVDYLEPLTTPYILPCTHIALTGQYFSLIYIYFSLFMFILYISFDAEESPYKALEYEVAFIILNNQ